MVAKITTPSTIGKALNYNEKKVQKGVATCLFAGNFLQDAGHLTFHDKLSRFTALINLNNRAKTNTLHVSLNFDPSEKLSPQTLVSIATTYVNKIGFGEQPYLVYEHRDAGHPHLHIVTTNIRENGKRIDTYNIGRNASQKAREEIETAFGLIKATGRTKTKSYEEPAAVQKILYGKTDTKQSIGKVLNSVINRYRFASLAELNVVLKLYNLMADGGSEGSRIQRHEGLTYRVLDEAGNKIGVPIKASSFYFKPTLKNLSERFEKAKTERLPFRQKLKTAVDFVLAQKPADINDFAQRLKNEKITVAVRVNAVDFIYGLTFIDHRTACVFNGSDLGKEYSAVAIQRRLADGLSGPSTANLIFLEKAQRFPEAASKAARDGKASKNPETADPARSLPIPNNKPQTILNDLLRPEKEPEAVPFAWRKKKKRKR